jgi:hypothetical protein
MIARRFRSPLLGTTLVLAALAMLAVPLHRLTTRSGEALARNAEESQPESTATRAVLRVRVLEPLEDWEIKTTNGHVLHRAALLDTGELEEDVEISLDNGHLELLLRAQAGQKETAVFVTLLPEGYEERTAYSIGAGILQDTLHFHWEHEHE